MSMFSQRSLSLAKNQAQRMSAGATRACAGARLFSQTARAQVSFELTEDQQAYQGALQNASC